MRVATVALLVWFSCPGGIVCADEFQIPAPGGGSLTVKAADLARDRDGTVHARGRVEATHGAVSIACVGTVTIRLSNKLFSTLDAQGMIEARTGDKKLWGQQLYYEDARRLITVSGEPRAQQGATSYRAEKRILCYTGTGVMKFEPAAKIHIDKPAHPKKAPGRKRLFGIF